MPGSLGLPTCEEEVFGAFFFFLFFFFLVGRDEEDASEGPPLSAKSCCANCVALASRRCHSSDSSSSFIACSNSFLLLSSSSFLRCRRVRRNKNLTRVASCTSPLQRSGRGGRPVERGACRTLHTQLRRPRILKDPWPSSTPRAVRLLCP